MFDLAHLKKIRKQLNLTQHELAKNIGISQSMIAKIEAGRLDPTYSYVKKIHETIIALTQHHEFKAKDIMTKKVLSVNKTTSVNDIIALLATHNISQVPVLEKERVVGLVTESSLLHGEGDIAGDVMLESPPLVSKEASLSAIKPLLEFYPLVLVQESAQLVGVITKADVLKNLRS